MPVKLFWCDVVGPLHTFVVGFFFFLIVFIVVAIVIVFIVVEIIPVIEVFIVEIIEVLVVEIIIIEVVVVEVVIIEVIVLVVILVLIFFVFEIIFVTSQRGRSFVRGASGRQQPGGHGFFVRLGTQQNFATEHQSILNQKRPNMFERASCTAGGQGAPLVIPNQYPTFCWVQNALEYACSFEVVVNFP